MNLFQINPRIGFGLPEVLVMSGMSLPPTILLLLIIL